MLFPLIACGVSLIYLLAQVVSRASYRHRRDGYDPLRDPSKVYGIPVQPSVENNTDNVDAVDEEDEDDHLVLQRTVTSESTVQVSRPRGENVVVLTEMLAVLGEIGISLAAFLTHAWGRSGTLAAISGIVTWGYILILASSRLFLSNIRRNPLPKLWGHTTSLYIFQWLFTVMLFRSAIIHPKTRHAQAFMITDFVLATVLVLIAITTRKGNKPVLVEYEDNLEPSPEPLASLFSLFTFSWVDGIIWKGFNKTLELSDVWNLVPKDKAANILADFRQVLKTSKLSWHLLSYFKRELILQAIWAAISGVITFAPTLLLKAILEYVENPIDTPANAAWFYIILLALSSCVTALADGRALWIGRKVNIRLRAILIGEIYAKSLRRKAASGSDKVLGKTEKKGSGDSKAKRGLKARLLSLVGKDKDEKKSSRNPETSKDSPDSQVNTGTIINLMAVDTFKVGEICSYLHYLWSVVPVELFIAVFLLYWILGNSSLAGIFTMVALLPLNYFITSQFNKIQKKLMAATDARIHTTNEVFQNIRIIKYFAWEQRFSQIVNDKRREELKDLRNRYIVWTCAATIWNVSPVLITFITFLFYTAVEKKDLIPSVAFTALSLFSLLRIPLDRLADMLAHVQEAKVSVDRIEEFLNEDDTEKYDQLLHKDEDKEEPHSSMIGFEKATFSWGSKDTQSGDAAPAFRMINLDIKFSIGRLNIVAGPTGSGKTSLLMALLGEMTILEGSVSLPGGRSREDVKPDSETGLTESVAFCAQQAWLVNDTIKQNILFASPWDEERYLSVIDACALQKDLEILDAGDGTLVGEKGITLSGGQKQRISLARALYCNARHVLLDDCLSAVDSHTAKHIFERCIMGPLMFNRTCILVTHNVALCVPLSEHVVVLANGKVATQGPPEVVMSAGALGDEVLKSRPTSKSGTQDISRVQSTRDLDSEADSEVVDNAKKANGHTNGSVKGSATAAKPGSQSNDENANARTESKAEGSVKWKIMGMYLAAMGSWFYWIIAVASFAGQQVGSAATNLWIRQWANSYQSQATYDTREVGNITLVNYVHAKGSSFFTTCLSSGTCTWSLSNTAGPSTDDCCTSSPTSVDLSYYLGVYAILALVYALLSFFRIGILFWGSIVASWEIHDRLLTAVSQAKFKFFDTTPLGQIMNRFSKDVESLDQEVAPAAIGVMHCVFSLITIVVLISVITPGFLIAGFFISLIYVAIGAFYIKSSRDLKRIESVQRSPLYQQFGETLSGVTTIRAYGDERRFIRDNQSRVNKHNRPFIFLWATNRWLALRVDFAGALVSFFSALFIILKVGSIDAGAAGLALTYAVTFNEYILWVVRLYAENEQNMNAVERIKDYIDVEKEAGAEIPETKPSSSWPSEGNVEFVNYSTRYRIDLDPVLRNLNVKIQAGEKVGIVGRTGAGKSSLAMALFRGLEADNGKIMIDGVDISQIGLRDLREAITIVPQDPTLFTGTIRSNLDPFGLFTDEEIFTTLRSVQLIDSPSPTRSSGYSSPLATKTVPIDTPPDLASTSTDEAQANPDLTKISTNTHENINVFLNLASPITESGSNLSQGQRQLLCLARALLKSPRVLLMDEATASIDYATDAKIQDTLRELQGKTIITIAHRLQTIADYDKVLVLDKGQVIEYDAPWELIRKEDGIFKGMCEMSGDFEKLVEITRKVEDKKKLIDV